MSNGRQMGVADDGALTFEENTKDFTKNKEIQGMAE